MFKQCYNVMCGNNVETMLLWKASSHKLRKFFRFWFSWEHVATTPSALPGPFMHVIGDDGHISCIVRQISTKTHLKNSNSTLKKRNIKTLKSPGTPSLAKPSRPMAVGCHQPSSAWSVGTHHTNYTVLCIFHAKTGERMTLMLIC